MKYLLKVHLVFPIKRDYFICLKMSQPLSLLHFTVHRLERADSPLTCNSNYRFLLVNHNCSTAGPPLPADLARLQCHFPAVVVLCRPVQLQPEHGQTYTDRTEEQNISTHFSSSLLLRILLEDFCPRIDSPVFP